MIFSRYTYLTVLIAILIALDSLALGWAIQQESKLVTAINLSILWFGLTALLIWRTREVNRDVTRFFAAFRHQDSTMRFPVGHKDKMFADLREEMNKLLKEFQLLTRENDKNRQFFQRVLEHLQVGLIAFDEEGRILLENSSLSRLLNTKNLKVLDDLKDTREDLPRQLLEIKQGEKQVLTMGNEFEEQQMLVLASVFNLSGKKIKVVSFQNIRSEMQASENEAWQKMIRVLTHEIMNSISPIRLTAAGMLQVIRKEGRPASAAGVDENIVQEFVSGLEAIKKRSAQLTKFIEEYRKMIRIPAPNPASFLVSDFIHEVVQLFKNEAEKMNIDVKVKVEPGILVIFADEKQLAQVMINIMKNGLQAMNEKADGTMEISAKRINRGIVITIKDNGPGIDKEVYPDIFTPFFSTKKGGTGIGLSVCRQIMKMNKGDIRVQSSPGNGTTVFLKLPG